MVHAFVYPVHASPPRSSAALRSWVAVKHSTSLTGTALFTELFVVADAADPRSSFAGRKEPPYRRLKEGSLALHCPPIVTAGGYSPLVQGGCCVILSSMHPRHYLG